MITIHMPDTMEEERDHRYWLEQYMHANPDSEKTREDLIDSDLRIKRLEE